MTQEEKQLLLKDLCARLPYGVKVRRFVYTTTTDAIESVELFNSYWLTELHYEDAEFKPYLRPMSSMTEEEENEYILLSNHCIATSVGFVYIEAQILIDWLDKKMFDYRGLIPMELALEAPDEMYKIKQL